MRVSLLGTVLVSATLWSLSTAQVRHMKDKLVPTYVALCGRRHSR